MEPMYHIPCIYMGAPDFIVKAVQIALAISEEYGK